MDYHFDEDMDTHVIDAINGQGRWWYGAYYSGGWSERNVFRMDMYPYKNGTQIRLFRESEERLTAIYRTFREEIARLAHNGGQVIIPEVTIQSPGKSWTFQDVVVTAHDVRSDVLRPGVVTALDALLSLAEQRELSQRQSGIVISPDVTQVRVRAHDLVDGYGGREVLVDLTISSGPDFEVIRPTSTP